MIRAFGFTNLAYIASVNNVIGFNTEQDEPFYSALANIDNCVRKGFKQKAGESYKSIQLLGTKSLRMARAKSKVLLILRAKNGIGFLTKSAGSLYNCSAFGHKVS